MSESLTTQCLSDATPSISERDNLSSSRRMGKPRRRTADRKQMIQVGIRLRWVREAMRKTQAEMADIIGVHQTAWSLYERGQRFPDSFDAIRICDKLKITLDYLLTGDLNEVEPVLATVLSLQHPELIPPNGSTGHPPARRAQAR